MTRAEITQQVWPSDPGHWSNTIDAHIRALRSQVDKPFATSLIKTIYGYGYKLERHSNRRIQHDGTERTLKRGL